MIRSVILMLFMSFGGQQTLASEAYRCRKVGADWVWFEDHVALYVNYATKGPLGRIYEIGTGVSVNGSPWGRRERLTGEVEFTAFGAGALHIRRRDSGSDFEVCASSNGLGAIPVYRGAF